MGDHFRRAAALRLLYYFPKECAEMIAQRLYKLDVSEDGKVDAYIRRCVANGVRSEEFIRSVAWCQDKAIQSALVRLFRRAEEVESLLAAIRAVDDRELIRKRVEPLIANQCRHCCCDAVRHRRRSSVGLAQAKLTN